ncbi:hypothetical protein MKW98_027988, partial [Papaver atlanticum]
GISYGRRLSFNSVKDTVSKTRELKREGASSTAGTGEDDGAAKNGKRKKCLKFK